MTHHRLFRKSFKCLANGARDEQAARSRAEALSLPGLVENSRGRAVEAGKLMPAAVAVLPDMLPAGMELRGDILMER